MKALTLTQPWATLVAIHAKHWETRGWSTEYRGPLTIHAAKRLGPVGGVRGLRELCETEPFRRVLTAAGYADPRDLPRGVVVCTARLAAVVPTHSMAVAGKEKAFGDFSPGRFAWGLLDVRGCLTGPVRGARRLWEWDESEGRT